ncbi:MAG: hypothetical protein KDI60_15815 [Xanthomonadales bacterium]|nr:hypothetical protein [Xanthomonadales bacterium]MCB1613200.1 hypothetical protein [Xanthomonadales bacterium]MCP5476403.1 hypothetical protein [Rhodanobacteraceae bacterium]
MPAPTMTLKTLTSAIALTVASTAAWSQSFDSTPLPLIVPDQAHPSPWPQAADGSTWVPVFVFGGGDSIGLGNAYGSESAGNVLVGVAQVRSRTVSGGETFTVAPSLRWRLNENASFNAAMTVTDFVPCRSLMQAPLAPLQSDACESFSGHRSSSALGVSGSLDLGRTSFTLGYSESPAIWVLPGSIGPAAAVSTPQAALPLAPLASQHVDPVRTVSLGGELSLSEQSRLGVALAMSRLPMLENSPDIGRVQFSVAYGDFSAGMAAQMIRKGIQTVSPWWASMDLGVSWRTPWSGIISVGARNLFSSGEPPKLGNSPVATANETDAFSRTPYVRYEQDF